MAATGARGLERLGSAGADRGILAHGRAVEVAVHLNDQVLPPLPLRQWVFSLPKRLCPFLPYDPATWCGGDQRRVLGRLPQRAAVHTDFVREHLPPPGGGVRWRVPGFAAAQGGMAYVLAVPALRERDLGYVSGDR
jgi:hypothetical protein